MENKFNIDRKKYNILYKINKSFKAQIKDTEELEKYYIEFLDNFCIFADKLGLTNPVEILVLYRYMLVNGYLSNDGIFKVGAIDTIDVNSLLGINIINGRGVCRHFSKGLSDILNYKGITSGVLTTYLEETPFTKPTGRNLMGNHNITIAGYNNKKYMLDVLNNGLCKSLNDDILVLKSNQNEMQKIILDELRNLNMDNQIKDVIRMIALPQNTLLNDAGLYAETRIKLDKEKNSLNFFAINNEQLYNDISGKVKVYTDNYNLRVNK